MFKFDLSSESYKTKADVISTIIGIGAGSLIGGVCDTFIDINAASGYKRAKMKLGKYGIESSVMFMISNDVRKNFDDIARAWNAIVDIFELNKAIDNNKASKVETEVVNV